MPVMLINKAIEKMTIQAVDCVYDQTLGAWELIIVLHGGTFFDYKINYPRIKVIKVERRMGIAEAYNVGFKEAKGDIFCCLHNDTIFPFGWNYLFEKVAREGNIGFPMVKEDYTPFDENLGVIPTQKFQPPACCFVFSRELFEELSGFDEDFKELHGEDIDFFKRAEIAGRKLVRCDVEVLHYRGATRALLPDGGNAALVRNFKRFNLKYSDGENVQVRLPKIKEFPEETMKIGG